MAIWIILAMDPLLAFPLKGQSPFPLRVSSKHKYLAGRNGKPFLIKEISAWGLIQALSEKKESDFMDSVQEKGFNSLLVSVISYDTRFAGNPPDWQGLAPFGTRWDFSTCNPAYFAHVDRFLRMALKRNILVLLVPCYLGYKGDKNQGWWDELLSPHNSVHKSLLYGRYLGQRYRGFPNIIWVAGGDNDGSGSLFDYMNNIIRGIKEFDPYHLWTGHFGSVPGTNWSSGNPLYAPYMDIDGLYDWIEKDLGPSGPQYKTELNQYGKGRVIFQMDQSYEYDFPDSIDNDNHQWIRRKNYDGLLSGCAGTSFSPGQPGNPCYTFRRWQPLMNTEGMREAGICFRLFGSRPWYRLQPDTGNRMILQGRGIFGKIDYVCDARTRDSSTLIAYIPRGHPLLVNLAAMAGKQARAWWYDPRKGSAIRIGNFPCIGNRNFVPPSNRDWILVMDEASRNIPPPGQP